MAYNKTTWVNDQEPSIDATNLNKMEQGIYDAQYPDGGTTGQYLRKTASGQEWADVQSSGGTWGTITGTLSNQTDLQTALDSKQGTLTAGANITIDANNVISSTGGGGGGGGDATWGSIAGDIANQTDLQVALAGKVNVETGKGLSTNDFTTAEKSKLEGIASGAEVNVQSNWAVTDSSSDAYIMNKPTIPNRTSDLTNDSGFMVEPSTGTTGQYLQKTASGTQWADVDALPSGGTTGQVLTKQSGADGDADWQTPTGGGAWGSITGTLSNQTDLQTALDEKTNLSNIATIETTSTASTNYTEGDFIVLNGQLYKVTTTVASGETWGVGLNIESASVGEELTALNNGLNFGGTASYIKFPSGVLICSAGATSVKNGDTVTFPIAFNSAPRIVVTPRYNTAATIRCVFGVSAMTATNFTINAWDTSTGAVSTSTTLAFYYMAFGTWK